MTFPSPNSSPTLPSVGFHPPIVAPIPQCCFGAFWGWGKQVPLPTLPAPIGTRVVMAEPAAPGWNQDGDAMGWEMQPRLLEVQHGGSSPHGLIPTVGHRDVFAVTVCTRHISYLWISSCLSVPVMGLLVDSSQLPLFPRRMQLCSKQALLCFQSAVI